MKFFSRTVWLQIINMIIILEFLGLLIFHLMGPISFKLAGLKVSLTTPKKPVLIIAGLWIVKQMLLRFPLQRFQKLAANTSFHYYMGLLTISAATLLLEITMTRIFSVIFFNHFAFLIISTALFGFALSGVFLSIFPLVHKYGMNKSLVFLSLGFGVSTLLTLKVVVSLPVKFGAVSRELSQLFHLPVYYLALGVPFFFSGMVIALLLSNLPKQVNRLYFYDLVGAGIGCFIIVLLIPIFSGSGSAIFAALMGFVSALFFSLPNGRRLMALCGLFLALGAIALLSRDRYFEIQIPEGKRSFKFHVQAGKIEFTEWSAVSRVDVADTFPYKVIWINGGANTAFMIPFHGEVGQLQPDRGAPAVYRLKENADILIVGPAGGEEVLSALSYNPRSIVGVELDPIITRIVQNEYKSFIGGIYNLPNVALINDEGRSYISRSKDKFDIIQQINNASPIAIASGALNLSETYLITVEAFHKYLDHLKEDGYLYIRRWGAVRLAVVASQALRERGVKNPEDHMVVISEGSPLKEGFYLKKSPITSEELEIFHKYSKRVPTYKLLFSPEMKSNHNLYYNLISQEDGWKAYWNSGLNLSPATDDKPFFNHFKRFASFKLPENLPKELRSMLRALHADQYGLDPDMVLLVILVEAAVLSTVFILLPLYVFSRSGLRTRNKSKFLIYFFSLGLGFILIEIDLIQKFTLFIGYPAHSVTAVLFSILVSAGIGSYLSSRFVTNLPKSLTLIVLGINALVGLQLIFTPLLFDIFLGQPLILRILISMALITPLGVLLGMPFPLGIGLVNRVAPKLIPWVWGINGYATVIGSVLCVILALLLGFKAVLILACVIYLLGLVALLTVEGT